MRPFVRRHMGLSLAGLLGALPVQAELGHLNVPAVQHVQVQFSHQDGDPTNVYRVLTLLFPDGTQVADYRIPKGRALVLTDLHMQIDRLEADVSAPMDGVLQLSTLDRSADSSAALLLVTLPMQASALERRTALSHSFTAGFTFTRKMSPVMSPIAFGGSSVSGAFLFASGYLVGTGSAEGRDAR